MHLRQGRTTVVLVEPETATVASLREGLAEALVAIHDAPASSVGSLRLAVEGPEGWTEITHETEAKLADVGITRETTVGFALEGTVFEYEQPQENDEDP